MSLTVKILSLEYRFQKTALTKRPYKDGGDRNNSVRDTSSYDLVSAEAGVSWLKPYEMCMHTTV